MVEHLQSKHAPQMTMMGLDVDSLPNADDVQMLFPPGFLSADGEMQKDLLGVLDLSSAAAANGDGYEKMKLKKMNFSLLQKRIPVNVAVPNDKRGWRRYAS